MSDQKSENENPEEKGLRVGDPVRWESAGEGKIRIIDERDGVKVATVAPGGGWRWNEEHAYFTMEDTGADGVPIRLEDLTAAVAPRTPEERLERIQTWTKRLLGIARDASLAMEILKTETIGPGAHEALIAYHGGDRAAAGDTVRSFRASIEGTIKEAKTAAKAMKAVADAGDFIDESLAVAYQDLLTGQGRQTSIDDVEEGLHKEGGKAKGRKKRGEEAPPEGAPAGAEPPALLPWRGRRAGGPSGADQAEAAGPATGKPIEGDALLAFLTTWRAGGEQLGVLVPYDRIDAEGLVEVVIDFERRRFAADRVALIEQEAVKRDGGGNETVERVVLCTPELVNWAGFAGEEEPPQAGGSSQVQRVEAEKRGLTPAQIASVDAALRADPTISQVQLSKVTGVERTKIQRILKAGEG